MRKNVAGRGRHPRRYSPMLTASLSDRRPARTGHRRPDDVLAAREGTDAGVRYQRPPPSTSVEIARLHGHRRLRTRFLATASTVVIWRRTASISTNYLRSSRPSAEQTDGGVRYDERPHPQEVVPTSLVDAGRNGRARPNVCAAGGDGALRRTAEVGRRTTNAVHVRGLSDPGSG